MKQKIVVTFPFHFSVLQKKRLEKFGDVTYYNTLPDSPEEWMRRTEGANIICSGKSGLVEKIRDSSLWAPNAYELLEVVQGPDDCAQLSCYMSCMPIQ